MIASGVVLFLFGTAVSAGPFMAPAPTEIIISKNANSASDNIIEYSPYRSSGGSAPFIKNFIQKGTNVFFKPQFMLAAQQMPTQIQEVIAQIEKDDCKTSYPMGPVPVLPIVEEPLRIIEKEFTSPIVKEVIEINPMPIAHPIALPKLPVIIEEPCDIPMLPTYVPKVEIPEPIVPFVIEVEEPRPHVVIPPAPVLPPMEIPQVPMIIEVEQPKEIVMPMIPPAPVLPPMEMPKMPLLIEEPCAPVEIIHEVPHVPILPTFIPEPIVVEEKPVVIPPAPVLPPYVPPVLPEVFVEERFMEPLPPVVPCETVEIIEPALPMVIPEAPVLPPFVPVEIPAPVIVEEVFKPAIIPPAPILPPLEIPKISVLVEEPSIIPCPPGEEIHEIISKPIVLPEAPILPPFTMPKLPVELLVEEKFLPPVPTVEIIEEPIVPMVIPEAPVLPPLAPIEIPVPVIVEEPVKPVVLPPAPVLPPLEIPKTPFVVPCETVEIKEDYVRQPVLIPEAPILPPMAPMRIPTPIIVEEPVRPVLPSAPVLPPLAPFPRGPIVVERPGEVVVAPCPPENEVIIEQKPFMPMPFAYSELSLTKPIVVPTAPMAPEFYVHHNINEESVMVQKRPLLPFPQGCAEDIVVERILPKMEMALRPHAANAPVPIRYAPLGYALIK